MPKFKLDTGLLSDHLSKIDRRNLEAIACRLSDEYPNRYCYNGIDIVPIVNDSVRRYFFGRIPKPESSELSEARRQQILSSLIGLFVAEKIKLEWRPDVIFEYMANYSAWAPYHEYFKSVGVREIIVTSTLFDYNSVNVNVTDLYVSRKRFDRYLSGRKNTRLTQKESDDLKKVLQDRFSGRAQYSDSLAFFEQQDLRRAGVEIDRKKRNIFLFSNVYWDVGISELGGVFPSVLDWVLSTVKLVEGAENCQLFIKPHPGETYNSMPSMKSVVDFIEDEYRQIPENVSIIYPEMKISPYELIPFADVAVVFNGTLGIEMILNDVPVVSCGLSPYGTAGLSFEPQSAKEYEEAILGHREVRKPNKELVDLFGYFYFVKQQIPSRLTHQVYGDDFRGFSFESLDELLPGRDEHLDHLCDCILDPQNTVVEAW